MFRYQMRTVRVPGWLIPLLLLAALALIPVVLTLALGLLGLGLGVAAVRYWLLPSAPKGTHRSFPGQKGEKLHDPSVIDVDYQVKGSDEKK